MSIRVSQPAINLREKLTEVDSPPIGSHGSELMSSSTTKESFDLVKAGRKNMVINGDFQISQRATTVTGLSSGWNFSTVDRWTLGMSNAGTWTSSQDTDVPIGYGFTKSWKLDCTTADAAVDAGDYFLLEQRIEANRMAHLCWGTERAKPVTLSFWVKSSVTGDCNAMFHGDNFNVTRIINQTFAIHNANEWEFKTMTFPAPGPEHSWTTDNTTGIRLWLWFKAGTTWTAGSGTRNYWRNNASNQQAPGTTINIASSTANNLLITGVQLEEGYNTTPFDHKSYADQLHDCQRYFSIYHPTTQEWIYFESSTSNHKWWQTYVPTGMRGEPSVTLKGTCSTNNISAGGGTISGLAVQAIDNGGNSGTTHPGSMGRVSYRVTFTGSHGNAYEVRHNDGWGDGNGWVEYNSEF